jgi:hypothetical protein
MQSSLPPSMWRAYVEACVALADGLNSSARQALSASLDTPDPESPRDGQRSQAGTDADEPTSDRSRSGDNPPDRPHARPLGFRP